MTPKVKLNFCMEDMSNILYNLIRRGVQVNPAYLFCGTIERVLHICRDCPFTIYSSYGFARDGFKVKVEALLQILSGSGYILVWIVTLLLSSRVNIK